jgi:hypothetical protein
MNMAKSIECFVTTMAGVGMCAALIVYFPACTLGFISMLALGFSIGRAWSPVIDGMEGKQ